MWLCPLREGSWNDQLGCSTLYEFCRAPTNSRARATTRPRSADGSHGGGYPRTRGIERIARGFFDGYRYLNSRRPFAKQNTTPVFVRHKTLRRVLGGATPVDRGGAATARPIPSNTPSAAASVAPLRSSEAGARRHINFRQGPLGAGATRLCVYVCKIVCFFLFFLVRRPATSWTRSWRSAGCTGGCRTVL